MGAMPFGWIDPREFVFSLYVRRNIFVRLHFGAYFTREIFTKLHICEFRLQSTGILRPS